MKIIEYDIQKYNFKEIVCEYLSRNNLDKIQCLSKVLLSKNTDQSTIHHKIFYKSLDADNKLKNLYDSFIGEIIKPLFGEEFIYQKYPTFRIHYPENIAVFEFHKDKDYNHNSKEINFFLPITPAYDTNTIWIESKEDLGDFSPMNANYGQIVQFDGANLKHGNKINQTGKTRISFDFRILMKTDYFETNINFSITKGKKMQLGDYFQKFNT